MSELKLLQCRLDGRYDIEDCLGRGSYAEIYLARDNAATDEQFRSVVIKARMFWLKLSSFDLSKPDSNFQGKPSRSIVRHPNIISRLGHGTALDLNGTAFHYLVLEYLGRRSREALPPRRWRSINAVLVAAGVPDLHAHECGVIHRDIAPEPAHGPIIRLKIADFGVARIGRLTAPSPRRHKHLCGPEHNPLVQQRSSRPDRLSRRR
jgi:serine/threonine protein kinase